jgi:hypothetical protein
MKKIFYILILMVLSLNTLTACSNIPDQKDKGQKATAQIDNEEEKANALGTEELSKEVKPYESLLNLDIDTSVIPYTIAFTGSWNLIADSQYQKKMSNIFYTVYPRMMARWSTGMENKTVEFKADEETEDVAYAIDGMIAVSVKYANENPRDLGYFAHELMHIVQKYENFDSNWFVEGEASYAGFRYFHWAKEDSINIINQKSEDLLNWYYEPYGNCILFYAYMDAFYPTRKNTDGSISYGLLDSLHFAIKRGEVTSDAEPENPNTPFNHIVKEVTGYNTIEEIRQQYLTACKTGSWVFNGFSDYEDNFLTEEIEGIPEMEFPKLTEAKHGDYTASYGTNPNLRVYEKNVLENAKVIRCSGYINEDERSACLIDGDLNTKWCAELVDVQDTSYRSQGVQHFIVLDLGEEKTFNSYSIYNGGSMEDEAYNASSWELLVSLDGVNFTSVDYQLDAGENYVICPIKETSARYVMLKVYNSDNESGTLRLYEMMAGLLK